MVAQLAAASGGLGHVCIGGIHAAAVEAGEIDPLRLIPIIAEFAVVASEIVGEGGGFKFNPVARLHAVAESHAHLLEVGTRATNVKSVPPVEDKQLMVRPEPSAKRTRRTRQVGGRHAWLV